MVLLLLPALPKINMTKRVSLGRSPKWDAYLIFPSGKINRLLSSEVWNKASWLFLWSGGNPGEQGLSYMLCFVTTCISFTTWNLKLPRGSCLGHLGKCKHRFIPVVISLLFLKQNGNARWYCYVVTSSSSTFPGQTENYISWGEGGKSYKTPHQPSRDNFLTKFTPSHLLGSSYCHI